MVEGERCPDGEAGLDFAALFRSIPTPYLVMTPYLVVVDANPAYLANVGRRREELVGRPVFEVFPPTPDALDERGVPRVQVSFEKVLATGRSDTMPLQRYDIPDGGGGYTTRFWSLISLPVLDEAGVVVLVVQRAEDITDFVRNREGNAQISADAPVQQHWQRRVQEVETDLFARSQELAATLHAQQVSSTRLAGLAEVALQLTTAESVQDLASVLSLIGLPVLGAKGAAIAVRAPGSDMLTVTVAETLPAEAQAVYGMLPLDATLPAAVAARGTEVWVPDAGRCLDESVVAALAVAGSQASASLPLTVQGRLLGSLSVGWPQPRAFSDDEVDLLRAFAAQCAQVLDRLQVRQAERAAAAEVGRLSETLQRSLLSHPPDSPLVRVAVRYQPASRVAHVGGDWYDAFHVPAGLMLVIGDVAGHDRDAAAAMAQLRNLLRGLAVALEVSPAGVLRALDRAVERLDLGILATVLVAEVTQTAAQRQHGQCTLTWSNAGHPPPVLLRADGTASLLERSEDLLCGFQGEAERCDHTVQLDSADTVLLYTDGLVETRTGDLSDNLELLRQRVGKHTAATGPQALVDILAEQLLEPEDDVALLALQVRSPRPALNLNQ